MRTIFKYYQGNIKCVKNLLILSFGKIHHIKKTVESAVITPSNKTQSKSTNLDKSMQGSSSQTSGTFKANKNKSTWLEEAPPIENNNEKPVRKSSIQIDLLALLRSVFLHTSTQEYLNTHNDFYKKSS